MNQRSGAMHALIAVAAALAVLIAGAACAVVVLRHKNLTAKPADSSLTAAADTTAGEAVRQTLSAEEIIDAYYTNFALWTTASYEDGETFDYSESDHGSDVSYRFADVDFDGIPDLIFSLGDNMHGDSYNRYFHIVDGRVQEFTLSRPDDNSASIWFYEKTQLVRNTAANRMEYRSPCYRGSRAFTYLYEQSLTFGGDLLTDRSVYTDYEDLENDMHRYYIRSDPNSAQQEVGQDEYDSFVAADQAACKDLHLTLQIVDGEAFFAAGAAQQKALLQAALLAFDYDGFTPGFAAQPPADATASAGTTAATATAVTSAATTKAADAGYPSAPQAVIDAVVKQEEFWLTPIADASLKAGGDRILKQFENASKKKFAADPEFYRYYEESFSFIGVFRNKNNDENLCVYKSNYDYRTGPHNGLPVSGALYVSVKDDKVDGGQYGSEGYQLWAHGMLVSEIEEKAEEMILDAFPEYADADRFISCAGDGIHVHVIIYDDGGFEKETKSYLIDYGFTTLTETDPL